MSGLLWERVWEKASALVWAMVWVQVSALAWEPGKGIMSVSPPTSKGVVYI
jgi:hypothetical protein